MAVNFFDQIRNFFTRRDGSITADSSAFTAYNEEVYLATRLKEAQDLAPALKEKFGTDFYTFFYGHGKKFPLPDELLNMMGLPQPGPIGFNNDHWADKHPFNFPGPFYTAHSDTCGTGHVEAPFNVLFDPYTMEYVFRQPSNYVELIGVINAGGVEVLDSYSCNGNSHWTFAACREWWSARHELINSLRDPETDLKNSGKQRMYIDYLNTDAEMDLRKYCYFLENNVYPMDDRMALPAL